MAPMDISALRRWQDRFGTVQSVADAADVVGTVGGTVMDLALLPDDARGDASFLRSFLLGPGDEDEDEFWDGNPWDEDPEDDVPWDEEDDEDEDPEGEDPEGEDPEGEDPEGEDPEGEDPKGEEYL